MIELCPYTTQDAVWLGKHPTLWRKSGCAMILCAPFWSAAAKQQKRKKRTLLHFPEPFLPSSKEKLHIQLCLEDFTSITCQVSVCSRHAVQTVALSPTSVGLEHHGTSLSLMWRPNPHWSAQDWLVLDLRQHRMSSIWTKCNSKTSALWKVNYSSLLVFQIIVAFQYSSHIIKTVALLATS